MAFLRAAFMQQQPPKPTAKPAEPGIGSFDTDHWKHRRLHEWKHLIPPTWNHQTFDNASNLDYETTTAPLQKENMAAQQPIATYVSLHSDTYKASPHLQTGKEKLTINFTGFTSVIWRSASSPSRSRRPYAPSFPSMAT